MKKKRITVRFLCKNVNSDHQQYLCSCSCFRLAGILTVTHSFLSAEMREDKLKEHHHTDGTPYQHTSIQSQYWYGYHITAKQWSMQQYANWNHLKRKTYISINIHMHSIKSLQLAFKKNTSNATYYLLCSIFTSYHTCIKISARKAIPATLL